MFGAVMSRITLAGRSIEAFLVVDLGVTALLAWIFIVRWPVLSVSPCHGIGMMIFWMAAAGISNSLGLFAVSRAMRTGHNGVVWALSQSAMLISFLAGVILWKDSISFGGWMGVMLIMVAMVWLGLNTVSSDNWRKGGIWVWLAFLAMLLLGVGQVMTGIPSRWPGWIDTGNLRLGIFYTASVCVPAVVMFRTKARIDTMVFISGLIAAALSVVSTLLLFYCLDRMAQVNQAGMAFPVAVAACVASFSLYSWFWIKEERSWRLALGLAMAIAGILWMAI
jgi:uncharacterized membrane protein